MDIKIRTNSSCWSFSSRSRAGPFSRSLFLQNKEWPKEWWRKSTERKGTRAASTKTVPQAPSDLKEMTWSRRYSSLEGPTMRPTSRKPYPDWIDRVHQFQKGRSEREKDLLQGHLLQGSKSRNSCGRIGFDLWIWRRRGVCGWTYAREALWVPSVNQRRAIGHRRIRTKTWPRLERSTHSTLRKRMRSLTDCWRMVSSSLKMVMSFHRLKK